MLAFRIPPAQNLLVEGKKVTRGPTSLPLANYDTSALVPIAFRQSRTESFMHVNVNIRTPIAREVETDFIVQILVDMLAPGEFASEPGELKGENPISNDEEEADSEFLVGRVWAERLDWTYAEECGYSVAQICDASSGTWMQILETLSRNGGRSFRKDLNLDNFVNDIVFAHEMLIHPDIIDRVSIVDASIRAMSGENSLVLTYHDQSEQHHLEDWEYRDLGFKKIARSNLLIRDNHYRYPFGESYCSGRASDFRATSEHETWILESWENLITDHPSL